MSGNFIVNTPQAQIHALAFQGIMVASCYPQLQDLLRKKLGEDYVLLFAEPVFNTGNQSIDWYTPVQGEVRPLASLPPDHQHSLRDRLLHMAQELRSLADTLKKAPEHAQRMRGHILELALRYPDSQCLFVVGGQPVFTCWGFGPGTPGAAPQDLWGLSPFAPPGTAVAAQKPAPPQAPQTPPPPVTPAAPARRNGWGRLWWLLPLAALLFLLWLILTPSGQRIATQARARIASILTADTTPPPALAALEREAVALENDLAPLREDLARHVAQCRPAAPVAPATPLPPATTPPREDALIIPRQPQNLSFLQGQWRCETGLVNSRTREPLVVEFAFDEQGKGTGRIFEATRRCTGSAQGELTAAGTLRITLEEQRCNDHTPTGEIYTYERQEILCHDRNGIAQCLGHNPDGSRWEARFLRKH